MRYFVCWVLCIKVVEVPDIVILRLHCGLISLPPPKKIVTCKCVKNHIHENFVFSPTCISFTTKWCLLVWKKMCLKYQDYLKYCSMVFICALSRHEGIQKFCCWGWGGMLGKGALDSRTFKANPRYKFAFSEVSDMVHLITWRYLCLENVGGACHPRH